jgi:hypothetical protein
MTPRIDPIRSSKHPPDAAVRRLDLPHLALFDRHVLALAVARVDLARAGDLA